MFDFEKLKAFYRIGADLTLNDIRTILQETEQHSYRKGELLSEAGNTEKYIYFIRIGLIRIYLRKETGAEITFGLLSEFSVYTNFDVLLFGQASRYHVQALEETAVSRIQYDVLMKRIKENPKLGHYRENIFQAILRRSIARVESLVLLTPEERYIDFVKNNRDLCNRVPDKYIAHYLGITPVSLSRIRKRIVTKKSIGSS